MNGSPRVSIVIPTMNRRDKLVRLIASVVSDPPVGGMEIIVVDNGSTDGTADLIRSAHPDVRLIEHGKNLYSSAARNAGADAAHGRHVFFLDDDNVLGAGCVGKLADALDAHPEIGLVAPLMLRFDAPDEIWCAGGLLDSFGQPSHHLGGTSLKSSRLPDLRDADYFPNAYMIRGSLARSGMRHDEKNFPHNWAEQDFCVRIREAGFRVTLVAAAMTWHDLGYRSRITRVSPDGTLDQARARIFYRRKYLRSLPQWFVFLFVILPFSTAYYLANFRSSRDGFVRLTRAYFRGTLEGFLRKL